MYSVFLHSEREGKWVGWSRGIDIIATEARENIIITKPAWLLSLDLSPYKEVPI